MMLDRYDLTKTADAERCLEAFFRLYPGYEQQARWMGQQIPEAGLLMTLEQVVLFVQWAVGQPQHPCTYRPRPGDQSPLAPQLIPPRVPSEPLGH
jgi:hypothetical protein